MFQVQFNSVHSGWICNADRWQDCTFATEQEAWNYVAERLEHTTIWDFSARLRVIDLNKLCVVERKPSHVVADCFEVQWLHRPFGLSGKYIWGNDESAANNRERFFLTLEEAKACKANRHFPRRIVNTRTLEVVHTF